MQDILSVVGNFLTKRDLFMAATVNHEWYNSQIQNKKNLFREIKKQIFMTHMCNNCCPCFLEKYYQSLIADFKLKRYICSTLNGEEVPNWVQTYME